MYTSMKATPGYHKKAAQQKERMPVSQISGYGNVYLNCSAELFPFQTANFDLRKRLAVLPSFFFPSKHQSTSFFKNQMNKVYIQTPSDPKISDLNSVKSNS